MATRTQEAGLSLLPATLSRHPVLTPWLYRGTMACMNSNAVAPGLELLSCEYHALPRPQVNSADIVCPSSSFKREMFQLFRSDCILFDDLVKDVKPGEAARVAQGNVGCMAILQPWEDCPHPSALLVGTRCARHGRTPTCRT